MVSTLASAAGRYQDSNRKDAKLTNGRSVLFPFAPQSSIQSHGNSAEALVASGAQNPFHSPAISDVPSTDDEGDSSGQDEFHLERYSQETSRFASHSDERGREDAISYAANHQRRRPKPELNVLTDVPGTQARACEPGLVVEQVHAQKAAKYRPKSVASQKPVIEYPPSASVKEKRDHATKRMESKKLDPRHEIKSKRKDSYQKPIVIGISIPKDQLPAHNYRSGTESAITLRSPTTPTIVVTPANDAPWTTSNSGDGSHIVPNTSSAAQSYGRKQIIDKAPPVPPMPANFVSHSYLHKSSLARHETSGRKSMDSAYTLHNDADTFKARRLSSESQEQMLQSADTARPRSKGWWNLALSPMLSRAGTLKSIRSRAQARESEIPPVPRVEDSSRSRSRTLESDTSPETPRRLGLAEARASTWSTWTTWEKQREDGERAVGDNSSGQEFDNVPKVTNTRNLQLAPNDSALTGHGLAAEYYHACAVDQLSGTGYFECQNHSCAERLPKLQSVFDHGIEQQADKAGPTPKEVTFGAVVMPDMPDPTRQPMSRDLPGLKASQHHSSPFEEPDTAAVSKAKTFDTSQETTVERSVRSTDQPRNAVDPDESAVSSSTPPSLAPLPAGTQTRNPRPANIVPPNSFGTHAGATVVSPGPISPEAQTSMASQGAVPMSELSRNKAAVTPQTLHFHNQYNYPAVETERDIRSVSSHATQSKSNAEVYHRVVSYEEETEKTGKQESTKPGLMKRLKSCAKKRKEKKATISHKQSKKRRCIVITMAILLPLMLIGIVVTATQITRKGTQTPTQSQWLNLTGFPPMPTGISTIVRPDNVHTNSQCVAPGTLWSCAVPKENQFEIAPNDPDQPNFRFEVVFRNGTVPANLTIPLSKRAHDPFTNDLFTPNPAPPSQADQNFMGNTTDNVTQPFDGEQTPFFMTFIPVFPVNPYDSTGTKSDNNTLFKRFELQTRQATNVSDAIPAPDVLADGSVAPANLLPVSPQPTSQPIKLYNRGLATEHYGFYMYYDKAIFLSDTTPLDPNTTASDNGLTEDQNGGALRSQAKLRCTFSQTRFLVQMWTNPAFGGHLLGPINTTVNSAMDYTPPGSFPYPTTITIDRHGGNINKKAAFCYGMNNSQLIERDVKAVVIENRGVDGTIINPAPDIIDVTGDQNGFDPNAGGIDGGTGGCGCVWQNWN